MMNTTSTTLMDPLGDVSQLGAWIVLCFGMHACMSTAKLNEAAARLKWWRTMRLSVAMRERLIMLTGAGSVGGRMRLAQRLASVQSQTGRCG